MSNANELLRRALDIPNNDEAYDYEWAKWVADTQAFLDAQKEAEPVVNKKALLEKILKIPRRIEPLGGQRTSYVQLDEVVGWIEEYEKLNPPRPEPARKPMTTDEIEAEIKRRGYDLFDGFVLGEGIRFAERYHGIDK